MKVSIVGGGPGGAFAALLMKNANPDWTIDVYERYPPATTYGWAIVLPEKIYPVLREADEPTVERIRDVSVSWDPIVSIHRDERIKCGGHPYTSVMRNELLEILQERCRELGVNLNFEIEANPVELAESSNLLIGADGLGSTTREAFAEEFDPTLIERKNKYSWFGTDQRFDALTHIYKENEHGVWHGAAYPARSVSTFAISTDPKTWENAGMVNATEAEYLDYLEDLFAEYLDGHGLRSKEDRWRNFLTVKNGNWHHENVVLLGDAAHTAHFTIGSGTRMAMEDAITLTDALDRYPNDTDTAFQWYENQRKPHIEALQGAADLSVDHFENLHRFIHADPEQLAFLYLTRTGWNSYETLRDRDSSFIDQINRWFADRSGGDPDAAPANQPFSLREVTLKNRIVTPIDSIDTATEGVPSDSYLQHLIERSQNHAGMVITDPVAVEADGRITSGTPGLYEDDQVDVWSRVVDRVHDHGTQAGITLVHAGRRGAAQPNSYLEPRPLPRNDAWELLAPSPLPYDDGWPTPTGMDEDDLDRVKDEFFTSAERADEAGFDLLSIHAGHGFLLGSFLSPLTNNRNDEYGGDLSARVTYPKEIVATVREAWPDSKPLSITLQATDWVDEGLNIDDAVTVARVFKETGCDVAIVVAGGTIPEETPLTDPSWHRRYSQRIRMETELATISTTHITNQDQINTMVAGGRADLCYLYDSK